MSNVQLSSIIRAYERVSHAERQIGFYRKLMDVHLDALSKALKDGDMGAVMFEECELENIRTKLLRLEYFNMTEGKK